MRKQSPQIRRKKPESMVARLRRFIRNCLQVDTFAIHSARTVILGRSIEVRADAPTYCSVVVDGHEVGGRHTTTSWRRQVSIFFHLVDESGRRHEIEVIFPRPWLSLQFHAHIMVDGGLAETLTLIQNPPPQRVCRHCGYTLKGLPVNNGEIACPECGRHNAVAD